MNQYNGIPIREVTRIGLPEVIWRKLHDVPRVPLNDPVAEALYQAGWAKDPTGDCPLDAISDPEEIVAIVRAAIALYAGSADA